MKKGYKIGLFFAIMLIVVLIILVLIKRANNKKTNDEPRTNDIILETPVDNKEQRTTCDTIVVFQNIDKKDGSITYEENVIAGKYINMTRSELEQALAEDSKVQSLSDKQKCFVSQHLELFSPEKITITRLYDSGEKQTGYYLMAVDHKIWIYQSDKTTVYFKTDMKLEDVPEKVQDEIINGKYMNSEIDIYHFLESYSS